MFIRCDSTHRIRNRRLYSNLLLIACIALLLIFLFINQICYPKRDHTRFNGLHRDKYVESFINRIRNTPIFNSLSVLNISYEVTGNQIPTWLTQYGIIYFFNFYWFQNNAYIWHLQRMVDLKQNSKRIKHPLAQIFSENYDQKNLLNYILDHPEHGTIIDTASDPIQPLFPSLPQASLPWNELCEYYEWLNNLYTNKKRIELLSPLPFKSLITYALYDVTIVRDHQIQHPEYLKKIHYDEIAYIFDSQRIMTSKTLFITQILPRIIRLLALTPPNTVLLLPFRSSDVFISEYIDILQERGLVNDTNRFIEYDPNEIYHGHVVYSTSLPRYDLAMLNKVLLADEPPLRRQFILLIRDKFDDYNLLEIIQTINLFQLSTANEHLRIQEYNQELNNLNETSYLFRQAHIIIGQHTDTLSNIVWCLPDTHVIEVLKKGMTTDYYEMSLQLKLKYWLAMTKTNGQIDIVHFRNLMLKVFTAIDA